MMKMALMAEAETVGPEVAQTERIGLSDLIIAGSLAIIIWILLAVWQFPGIYPEVWDEAAVAAGIRPAAHILPGYWRIAAKLLYTIFGFSAGNLALKPISHLLMGLITGGVYLSMREMLAFVMRARPQRSRRRSAVMQLASIVGALAFVFSDSVWAAGQCFSETTLLIVLSLIAIEFFFVFLRKGSIRYAYYCAFALGLLTAETPMGIVLMIAFIAINTLVLKYLPVMESPFFNPALIAVGKWYMTFIFIAALIIGIAVNCLGFVIFDGFRSLAGGTGALPLAYLVDYWGRIVNAADVMGWVLLASVGVLPFLVAMARFPSGADEELFLAYSTGMVFFLCGAVACAQSSFLPALWFWSYGTVSSSYLLSMVLLLSAFTLASVVTILGVDALCRNHRRLARQMFGRDEDETEGIVENEEDARDGFGSSRSTTLLRRAGMVIVPLFIVALMLPGRYKAATRELLAIINDYVEATVTEAGDAEYLFTDGKLDVAVELESHRRGGTLKCLSLMGGSSLREVYLRTRGLQDDEESVLAFGHDCGMGLRTWLRDRPEWLKQCVVQIGFDLWKRDGKMLPPMGGIVSRPFGYGDERERLKFVETAHKLAQRVLDSYPRGAYRKATERVIKEAFLAVQWRLARMCLYRGERYDLNGDAAKAIQEVELSKKLNDDNAIYKQMMDALSKSNQLLMQRLTPREGLQLALVRADFTMAKNYAETIIKVSPEDPDANFALGMHYLKEKQFTRSEEYLKRCLIRNHREPAVYNNLALVQAELGKFDAALINVEKALEILPNSAQVLDTKKTILRKRDAKVSRENEVRR